MCDNDEQLIPWMPNRTKSLYDGSGDIHNDPRNLMQRKPKPHSQYVSQIHGENDRRMFSSTLRKRINLSNPKWPLMIKPWYYWQTMQNPNINDMNIKQAQVFFFFGTTNKVSQRPYQHDLTSVPQTPNPNGPLKLKLLDQNIRVEQRVWQAWPATSRRMHIIITQEKIEVKRIERIETKLKDTQSEDAQCRKEEIMNDPKMKQKNNDTMDSQYSPVQTINAKRTRGDPQPRWEKVCKAKWTNRS